MGFSGAKKQGPRQQGVPKPLKMVSHYNESSYRYQPHHEHTTPQQRTVLPHNIGLCYADLQFTFGWLKRLQQHGHGGLKYRQIQPGQLDNAVPN